MFRLRAGAEGGREDAGAPLVVPGGLAAFAHAADADRVDVARVAVRAAVVAPPAPVTARPDVYVASAVATLHTEHT